MMTESDETRTILEGYKNDVAVRSQRQTLKPFLLLLLTFVLHFISYAICIPVLNFYIFDVISEEHHINISAKVPCQNSTNDSHHEEEELVQKEVADLLAPLSFIWFFPGLIPTLLLGPLIDRKGRKIGMLLPMTGTLLKQVIYLVVMCKRLPLWVLLFGNGIEGVTGGFAAMLMTGFGIVADLSAPGKTRTWRISVIEATQAISTSVAVFGTGYAIKYLDVWEYKYLVVGALALNFFNIIIVTLVLPETLEIRQQTPLITTLKNIRKCFLFYFKDTETKRRGKMILGIFAFTLTVGVNIAKSSVMNIFLAKRPLCWSELQITVVTSAQIIGNWILSLVFMKIVQKLLGVQDKVIGIVGCVSSIIACFILAFSTSSAMVYAVVGTSVFMRVTVPMIRSIMSRSVNQDEQGALYAGMGCVEMVFAAVIGSLAALIYRYTVSTFSGTVFVVLACIMVLVLGIFVLLNIITRRERVPTLSGYTSLNGSDRGKSPKLK